MLFRCSCFTCKHEHNARNGKSSKTCTLARPSSAKKLKELFSIIFLQQIQRIFWTSLPTSQLLIKLNLQPSIRLLLDIDQEKKNRIELRLIQRTGNKSCAIHEVRSQQRVSYVKGPHWVLEKTRCISTRLHIKKAKQFSTSKICMR